MKAEDSYTVEVKSKGKKLTVEDIGEKGTLFVIEYNAMGIPMLASITIDKETVKDLCKTILKNNEELNVKAEGLYTVEVKPKGKKLTIEDNDEKGKLFVIEYKAMGIPMLASITLDKETVENLCKTILKNKEG